MPCVRPFLACALAALLGGCVTNPYRATFTPMLSDKVPKGEPVNLPPASAPPRLLSTNDMRADAIKLLEAGYRPIGHSKFRGQFVEAQYAMEEAQAIGAEVVVVMEKFVSADTVSVPVIDWTPDRRVVVQESAQARASDTGAVQTFNHQSTTTIEGEYQTHYEPQKVETYDHSASYWRKAQAPILGILGSDLEDAQRKAQGSNKGVLVKAVVRNSPAFLADVFRDDIVRKLGDHEVLGTDDFFEQVAAQAGNEVELQLWRNGKTVIKTVTLAKR